MNTYVQTHSLEINIILCSSNLFLFLLWSEIKLFIENGPLTIDGFIDWVGCK